MKNRNCTIFAIALMALAQSVTQTHAQWTTNSPLATARTGHTATLLGNGKILVTGGYDYEVGHRSSSELYDPATGSWTATGALNTGRFAHTATLLPNGKVLVVGGDPAYTGAELYDPAAGTWSATGPLNSGRYYHTATLLHNGKVLVVGGSRFSYLSSAELFDAATGTWTATGSMVTARDTHTATLLPSGKVLIAGGADGNGSLSSAELYDPATGTWTATGTMITARQVPAATLLPNGKVLVVGGSDSDFNPIASAELYEPTTGTWTATGPLAIGRGAHSATLLPNGKVLVAGGGTITTVELYDPVTGNWTAAGALTTARFQPTATLLPSGKLVVAGGYSPAAAAVVATVDLYDSDNGTCTATSALTPGRYGPVANLLPNGKVLVAGGADSIGALSSAKLYDPATGAWTATSPLHTGRWIHTSTLLPNGKVLVAGGLDVSFNYLASAELYNPADGTWTVGNPFTTGRVGHTVTLLANGKVLLVGGQNPGGYLSSVQLYDPASGTWTTPGALINARRNHTATLLPNGKVLVTGGSPAEGSALASAELYDPASGTWAEIAALNAARYDHTATLLPNGKVLVAGGVNSSSASIPSAELYDPAAGTWTTTSSMTGARFFHTATLLLNGKVLVTGGFGVSTYLDSAELYDPATRMWTTTSALSTARQSHTATLLPNGKVLIAGGAGTGPAFLDSVELYDVGLAFNTSWQPQIATLTSPLGLGASLTVTGSRFRGISGGSGGNSQDSPADHPVVQLRSMESGQTLFLPATNWSTNSFTSAPVTSLPLGQALVTVFVNGIPSMSSVVAVVSVPPNQRPIVANSIPDTNSIYGSTFSYTFPANTFSDPDAGQNLSYLAGNLPPGISFDGPTRTFSGTPTNAGTFSVTVTATDNGTPPLNTNDVFHIVVAKASLIVTANNKSKLAGQPNPPLDGTLTGVTNNDNITATFTTTAVTGSASGNYPITPVFTDPANRLPNYTITTNAGTLTVDNVFTTLHSFSAGGYNSLSFYTNSEGANPFAGLIVSGNTLYGTTLNGGSSGYGAVFKVNTDGTGFTNLYSFTGNTDGIFPYGGLTLSGNALYGTTGSKVFKVNTDGTGFTVLHSLAEATDGAFPQAGLILSGNTLYGTASRGGSSFNGTVFAVNTDGAGFTNLHSLSYASDGANSHAGLILSGNTLYGTAVDGGSSGFGTVFAVNTNGTGFTNLHSFTGNSGGANPYAGLVLSGNILYGTANGGGISSKGTIFAVHTDGTGFTNLHSFTGSDGANTFAGLILSGNTLYGIATSGGSSDAGTVFAVHTDGTGFTNLYSFTAASYPDSNSDGAYPYSGLVLSGNALYGTAFQGGSSGQGTVFRILLQVLPNQPPIVANPIPDTNSTYGSEFNITFAANAFSDPDAGQNLSYVAGNLPAGIIFDGPTRTFSGTPTNAGTFSVTVTATDDGTPALNTNDAFNIVVDKASLTVSANNTNRPYGEANPAFTGTLVGVANSDDLTAAFTATATPGSLPGDYPITPTLLDPNSRLGNYIVTTNLATLTVNGVTLEFSLSGGSPNFCWPTNAADFGLEYTDSLTPPIVWQPVTSGITTNDSTICVEATPSPAIPTRFYRLDLP